MQEFSNDNRRDELVGELFPLAAQAARIVAYLADFPEGIGRTDLDLASRVGGVSAEHVAVVRRSLLAADIAVRANFETRWASSTDDLRKFAQNLLGVASYLRVHCDRDSVQLVLTEPGQKSALRRAIDDSRALSPVVFQTSDAFFSLARAAKEELTVLSPFLDHPGADFLLELFALCPDRVRRTLICRPLNEPECGDAFRRRAADFRRLGISVYEYALPSLLPSGRETFHAKVVLADASSFYVGSSNFMGSALDRSFECGVIVRDETARQLRYVLAALQSIARSVQSYS
jgi:phosphatidylserine/phosphatidylglycerophosphate/cardiolipin synthase-like enzyme